jgi:hypothetical protein
MKKYLLPLLAALALLAGCNDQDTAEKKAAAVAAKPGSQFIGTWANVKYPSNKWEISRTEDSANGFIIKEQKPNSSNGALQSTKFPVTFIDGALTREMGIKVVFDKDSGHLIAGNGVEYQRTEGVVN